VAVALIVASVAVAVVVAVIVVIGPVTVIRPDIWLLLDWLSPATARCRALDRVPTLPPSIFPAHTRARTYDPYTRLLWAAESVCLQQTSKKSKRSLLKIKQNENERQSPKIVKNSNTPTMASTIPQY
jgi:hypothetical protein